MNKSNPKSKKEKNKKMKIQNEKQTTEKPKGMNSPISWPGGKRLLANRIVGMFPEHTCYASVFAGALWDLFRSRLRYVRL
jgi:hypothetical protein